MSNRVILVLTSIVVGSILLLLGLNFLTFVQEHGSRPSIPIDHVRGSAVVKDGKEYTLNFSQQNSLINWLNVATPVGVEVETNPVPFDALMIYPFNQPPRRLLVLGKHQDNLILSVSRGHFLEDVSEGKLLDMLQETYD